MEIVMAARWKPQTLENRDPTPAFLQNRIPALPDDQVIRTQLNNIKVSVNALPKHDGILK
jgi:hypothetical protein